MDDAAIVRRLQSIGQLTRDPADLVERDWTGGQPFVERHTVDELEDERDDAFALFHPVDGTDVRVIQGRERPGLRLKARPAVGIVCERVRQYLDRDRTLKLRVVRAIDFPHPAGAE